MLQQIMVLLSIILSNWEEIYSSEDLIIVLQFLKTKTLKDTSREL